MHTLLKHMVDRSGILPWVSRLVLQTILNSALLTSRLTVGPNGCSVDLRLNTYGNTVLLAKVSGCLLAENWGTALCMCRVV